MRRLIVSVVALAAFTAGGAYVVLGNEGGAPQASQQSGGVGGGVGAGGLLRGHGLILAKNMVGGTGGGNMMGTGGGNMMGTGMGGGSVAQ
jgi:hypothetical protein